MAEPGGDLLLHHPAQGADPNDFADLADVEQRLTAFERRYEAAATPFEWKFTRTDLSDLNAAPRGQRRPTRSVNRSSSVTELRGQTT
jgi:hypothetical protein